VKIFSDMGCFLSRRTTGRRAPDATERVVCLPPTGAEPAGRALVSYLREPVIWAPDDPRLAGHSNQWECREIVTLLRGLGYATDVVDFRDHAFVPEDGYDVVLALDGELCRLSAHTRPSLQLLHLTGAYGPFQNDAERRRIDAVEARRGVRLALRRMVDDVEVAGRALADADACTLIGNEWTLGTYPAEHQGKITPVPVSGSVPLSVRRAPELAPRRREFLWFFGSGAVHKGLDLVLEAFADLPDYTLRIVGNVDAEADFWEAYAVEAALPNIHVHGFLDPASRTFRRATRHCFCVIAPSCSEGTSPAIVTMLQMGLLPLVSRQTGVSLPSGAGRYLEDCSIDEIAAAVQELAALTDAEVIAQATASQTRALAQHSRSGFSDAMRIYLERVVAR
jgi:hypothetical protein